MQLPGLIIYPWNVSVIQVETLDNLAELRQSKFLSMTATPHEISIVCETAYAPANAKHANNGWCCIGVEGPLDFSMVGVLAPIATALAEARISIFVVSSFDTDYVLVKQETLADTCRVLEAKGYVLQRRE